MTYLPHVMIGVVLFLIGSIIFTYYYKRGGRSPFLILLFVPGFFITILFSIFAFRSQEFSETRALKPIEVDIEKLVVSSVVETMPEDEPTPTIPVLTEEELHTLSADDIYHRYSEETRRRIDDLYRADNLSKEYGLKMMGRTVDQTLTDINGEDIDLTTGIYTLVVLNQGKPSEEAVKYMEENGMPDGVSYIAYFPTVEEAEAVKRMEEWSDSEKWMIVSGHRGFATDTLEVVGAPTLVGIRDGKILLAATNYERYDGFLNDDYWNDAIFLEHNPSS